MLPNHSLFIHLFTTNHAYLTPHTDTLTYCIPVTAVLNPTTCMLIPCIPLTCPQPRSQPHHSTPYLFLSVRIQTHHLNSCQLPQLAPHHTHTFSHNSTYSQTHQLNSRHPCKLIISQLPQLVPRHTHTCSRISVISLRHSLFSPHLFTISQHHHPATLIASAQSQLHLAIYYRFAILGLISSSRTLTSHSPLTILLIHYTPELLFPHYPNAPTLATHACTLTYTLPSPPQHNPRSLITST